MATYKVIKPNQKINPAYVPVAKQEIQLTDTPFTTNFLQYGNISDQISVKFSSINHSRTGFLFNIFDKDYSSYLYLNTQNIASTISVIEFDVGRLILTRGGLISYLVHLDAIGASTTGIVKLETSEDGVTWSVFSSITYNITGGTDLNEYAEFVIPIMQVRFFRLNFESFNVAPYTTYNKTLKIYDFSLFV